MLSLECGDYSGAVDYVDEGMEQIRNFYRENARLDLLEQSGELQSLENWLSEIQANRPLSAREKLERALNEAVRREDYERAAQVRDALRNLEAEK
jgi:excinuclease UvrABC helicase subunit UvrB